MRNNPRKRNIFVPIIIIMIAIFLMVIGFIVYNAYVHNRDNKTEREYDNIRPIVYVERDYDEDIQKDTISEEKIDLQEEFLKSCNNRELYEEYLFCKSPDFSVLKSNNEDTVAYIEIPGTEVSYPVLQSKDNSFYLQHSITKKENPKGAIYIENYNKSDFNDSVTVIYGHHLVNKCMFGSLTNYDDEDYFNNHKYFFVYTPENTYVYEVVLASKYSTDHLLKDAFSKDSSGEYIFNGMTDDMAATVFTKLVKYKDNNERYAGVDISAGDKLVVLSTCCDNSMHRYLVVGKRIL